MLTFRADQGDAGGRLDRAVLRHGHTVSGLSRTRVQQWIADGRVTVDDAPVSRAAAPVPAGARVAVDLPPDTRLRERPAGEPGSLEVVFEDETLLVVSKPAGLVAHPSYRNETGTLLNHVLWHLRDTPDAAPGLVSRLDKGTSGLVAVALTSAAHARLQHDAARGHIEKDYLALVEGRPSPGSGRIDLALGRDPRDRRRVVVTASGAPAETRYTVMAAARNASLVRCRLVTGRMHQIRVHLAARGWPILGDGAYGVPHAGLDRPALHAWRLALPHPVTGDTLSFEAPLPPDIRQALASTGLQNATL